MKNHLFLMLLTGSAVIAKSQDLNQNARYIEVTISDSMELQADKITYQLDITQTSITEYPVDYTDDYNGQTDPNILADKVKRDEEEKLKIKMQEKKVIEILEKEKLNFSRKDNETNYYLNMYNTTGVEKMKGFSIQFNSSSQLQKFIEKIPAEIKYSGKVMEIICTKQKAAEEKLMEKAYQHAKKQAENIAKFSNVKLGNLIQFSDNEGDNLMKGLERLLYSIPKLYDKSNDLDESQKIIILKTVRVRFSIE